MSRATTNYISFLSCLYSVGFLCQLLFDIKWFILEYIITACTVVQAVVKATSQSNGKGQILTPRGSETTGTDFDETRNI